MLPRPSFALFGSTVAALVASAAIMIFGAALIYQGIDPARAYFDGTPGRVAVSDCRWVVESKARGWDCRGSFAGQGIHIADVRVRYLLDAEPGGPVDAVVSGPDARVAWTPGGELLVPMAGGVFMVGMVPAVWLIDRWRDRGERTRRRAQETARRRRGRSRAELDELQRGVEELRRDLRELRQNIGTDPGQERETRNRRSTRS